MAPARSVRFVPARHPHVVIAVALSFAAVASAEFSPRRAVVAAIVAVTLVVVSAIDLERRIIPNRIVLPATGAVLCAQLALFPDQASEWIVSPLVLALALAIPQLLGRAWMGMGDVKLALLLGAGLGWAAFSALLLAFACVLPAAVVLLVTRGAAARKATIPFGPFMALGALIVLFAPHMASLVTG
jgi:leader peptidase (prepilin peptidase)/N-methyltransferase